MPRRPAATPFDAVRTAAAGLPGVEEGTTWGVPALKLRGRLLACMTSHKSAEPGTLAVRVSDDQRDAMIADDPDTYYVKPHYLDYSCVLVRLARVQPDALRDLLHAGWRFVDAKTPKATRPRAAKPRRRAR
jgi:hypothetical protein